MTQADYVVNQAVQHSRPIGRWIACAVIVLNGCNGSPPPGMQLLVPEYVDGCAGAGCGQNEASLGNNISFHELDASGVSANDAGLKYIDFRNSVGDQLELLVEDDRLAGRHLGTQWDLSDNDLLLSKIRVSAESKNGPVLYDIEIVGIEWTPFWVGPQQAAQRSNTRKYLLKYYPVTDPNRVRPLCKPDSPEGAEYLDAQAFIFRGDRYDANSKTVVDPGSADPWFNIACERTAIAKLHLLRHSYAGRLSNSVTMVEQRTAMLKLLTADYCGTGFSFTTGKLPLNYTFNQSWPDVPTSLAPAESPVESFEALWDENGALCVNVPRLADMYDVGDIEDECVTNNHQLGMCPPIDLANDLPWPIPVMIGGSMKMAYAASANPCQSGMCPP